MRFLTLFLAILISSLSIAKEPLLYVIEIKQEINASSSKRLSKGLKEAIELNADYVILHLNTYGGAVDAADSMRTALLNSPIPSIAFIDNQAASAGALISIACDSIYMRRGGSIGAATVVNQTGEVMPDKYQSFMRAMMRATAEVNGRDPKVAESMVDATNVLSFTPEEAQKNGYCEGIAQNLESVAEMITGSDNFIIQYQKLNFFDKILLFFLNPLVQGVLLMLIIGGIYFELQSPGLGFPSLAAITGAILYFSPLYIEGLAQNWEIIIFFAGILLILAEIFIIPGFGIAGISGIILMISGLAFAMVDNDLFYFDGKLNMLLLIKPVSIVLLSAFLSLTGSVFLAGRLFNSRALPWLSLKTALKDEDGFVGVKSDFSSLIGREATVLSHMRPSGKVEIDGEWFEATMDSGIADKGDKVIVTRFGGGRLYCENPLQ